jgi:uncharacterized protein (DUF305 family)
MKASWRIAIFLLWASTAAVPAKPQTNSQSQGNNATASPEWVELSSDMKKMHVAMASVESSGDGDADFVRLMIPHHIAAIDMARTQLLHGKDAQIRRLAQEIIADQQSEVDLMELWMNQHGSGSWKADEKLAVPANKEK